MRKAESYPIAATILSAITIGVAIWAVAGPPSDDHLIKSVSPNIDGQPISSVG